jgi:hypothetical protein
MQSQVSPETLLVQRVQCTKAFFPASIFFGYTGIETNDQPDEEMVNFEEEDDDDAAQ